MRPEVAVGRAHFCGDWVQDAEATKHEPLTLVPWLVEPRRKLTACLTYAQRWGAGCGSSQADEEGRAAQQMAREGGSRHDVAQVRLWSLEFLGLRI